MRIIKVAGTRIRPLENIITDIVADSFHLKQTRYILNGMLSFREINNTLRVEILFYIH